MKKLFLLLALPCMVCACNSGSDKAPILKTYNNPVLDRDAPDPTAIRAQDGKFYVYTTERDGNTPVYESSDLVTWAAYIPMADVPTLFREADFGLRT